MSFNNLRYEFLDTTHVSRLIGIKQNIICMENCLQNYFLDKLCLILVRYLLN